ncbi:hypothetical protein CP10139811_0194 [Chlamydia ibidis]|uniref:Uncharacterized protein n=1 Tax=Chlamydia ibidis TaxID=1405396 RepID=S7J5I3_9CHLA|nr:hypothetical protein CP10139811_0194 [Chlamydia ibidis]
MFLLIVSPFLSVLFSNSIELSQSSEDCYPIFVSRYNLAPYPPAYTVSQIMSKECENPIIVSKTEKESRAIWKEIQSHLNPESSYIPMIAYGSLMNLESAKKTISDYIIVDYVWVHDYQRVFNLDYAIFFQKCDFPESAVLNIRPSIGSRCNSVLLFINEDDFVACRQREKIYWLVPVNISPYPVGTKQYTAFAWVAFDALSRDILPLRSYYQMVWDGIVGYKDFAEDYLNTTFLANGQSIRDIHQAYITIQSN